MDLVLKGEKWKRLSAAYQDDVGLQTDGDLEDHVDIFIELAKTFEKARLTFAVKKCHIACRELDMYGYVVSREGIKVDKKEIKRIQEWPEPKNRTKVRSFHGAVGYY